MAKTNTNTKGTKGTKGTNAQAKEKEVMKATSKGKATTKTSAKAKENTMKATEMISVTINGIEVKGTQEQIIAIMNACANGTVKESKAKATSKGKSSAKKTASAKAEKPATKAEAIEQWKSQRYSDEEREAFGVAAREVREEMMTENKKMVKTVKGKKVYDDNYYAGAKWNKEFAKRMKERGFKVGK